MAPVTIGTFVIGVYESSYGYTSAVRLVYDRTVKFMPKQQVSALESDSLNAIAPGVAVLDIVLTRIGLLLSLVLIYEVKAAMPLEPSFQL